VDAYALPSLVKTANRGRLLILGVPWPKSGLHAAKWTRRNCRMSMRSFSNRCDAEDPLHRISNRRKLFWHTVNQFIRILNYYT
jgi:hypothetical protein